MLTICYIPLPDWFVTADRKIFELVNIRLANGFFDELMPLLRNPFLWVPLYMLIITFVITNFKKERWWWLAFVFATAACTDMAGARLFKEVFERLRPCSDPEMIGHVRMVLGRCSGGFSFVSNHAINHFGVAAFFFTTFRSFFKYAWCLFPWAALISLAQVYVGVHYPFDILFGCLAGLLIGTLSGKLFNKKIGFALSSISNQL